LGNNSRPTFTKRQKEQARAEKNKKKEEKREQRKFEKESRGPEDTRGVDPDIAHIIPGPQPLPYDE
jgi:hypothetical protein